MENFDIEHQVIEEVGVWIIRPEDPNDLGHIREELHLNKKEQL